VSFVITVETSLIFISVLYVSLGVTFDNHFLTEILVVEVRIPDNANWMHPGIVEDPR